MRLPLSGPTHFPNISVAPRALADLNGAALNTSFGVRIGAGSGRGFVVGVFRQGSGVALEGIIMSSIYNI